MISKMFTSRSRKQIKNKYLREQRLNPAKINKALGGHKLANSSCGPKLIKLDESIKSQYDQKSLQTNVQSGKISLPDGPILQTSVSNQSNYESIERVIIFLLFFIFPAYQRRAP